MFKLLPKLLFSGIIKRRDIVFGDGEMPEDAENILCIGNCSEPFAKRHNMPLIGGCPPSVDDICNYFSKKK